MLIPASTLPEALVWCSSSMDDGARGRDAVDLCLACLALGWRTGVLLSDAARDWLWAQTAVAAAPEPFARTLASLPLYELEGVWVLDDALRTWPALGGQAVQVVSSSALPWILQGVRRVLHP